MMKKILSIILTITILLGVIAVVPFSTFAQVTLDDSKVYIKCDSQYFEVEKGDTYTYEYCLKVSDSNVTGLDATTYYDADGLQFVPDKLADNSDDMDAMFPVLSEVVLNYADKGMVTYNYATADGDDFKNANTVVFRGNFLVTADSGVYEIDTRLKTLTDYEMDILAYNFVKLGKYEETELMPELSPVQETTPPTQAPTMNPDDTWVVAGEEGLCGDKWQMPPSESNYMTYNANTDRFEIVYTNIAAGTYEFKVINGTTWNDPNYNLDGQANSTGNASVTVSKSGSTVIISTDGTKAYVEVVEIATEAPTQKPTQAPTIAPTVAPTQGPTQPPTAEPTEAPTLGSDEIHVVAGVRELCGSSWDPTDKNNQMTYNADKGVYEITYKNVAAGTYEFKITTDYAWGNPEYNLEGLATNGGDNAKVTVPKSSMTVIISFDGTKAYVEVVEIATEAPTAEPTEAPTVAPTVAPTQAPTQGPTQPPTVEPTEAPTAEPTVEPTQGPTQKPTTEPTEKPTVAPTQAPTQGPTQPETQAPTQAPTAKPTEAPTQGPTQPETQAPTVAPTQGPTQPVTEAPTVAPTQAPTTEPTDQILPPTQPQIKIGDVDEDGIVNIFDATEIQLYLAKYQELSATQMIAADADKDGVVNIFDVTRIQLYLAKYITEF